MVLLRQHFAGPAFPCGMGPEPAPEAAGVVRGGGGDGSSGGPGGAAVPLDALQIQAEGGRRPKCPPTAHGMVLVDERV